jgi:hypothetical protein
MSAGTQDVQLRTPAPTGGTDAADGLLNFSSAERLLLPVVIFVTSVLTINFSRHSNLIATIWPANAIMLAALLRYARSPANYASIVGGGSAAAALAGLLAGNSLALSATLLLANLVEVVIAFALLAIFKITASTLFPAFCPSSSLPEVSPRSWAR